MVIATECFHETNNDIDTVRRGVNITLSELFLRTVSYERSSSRSVGIATQCVPSYIEGAVFICLCFILK